MDNCLTDMISQWHTFKKMESHYNDERIKTEEIIQHYLQEHEQWKESGTLSFDNLKIRLNTRRKWDQRLLTKIKAQYQLPAPQFPFLTEFKELKTQSDYLEAKEPQIWEKIVPALTLYAAKPYFFVSGKEK